MFNGQEDNGQVWHHNYNIREILEYIHNDLWRLTKTTSIHGSCYFVSFIDIFSRHKWVYIMWAKDDVLEEIGGDSNWQKNQSIAFFITGSIYFWSTFASMPKCGYKKIFHIETYFSIEWCGWAYES